MATDGDIEIAISDSIMKETIRVLREKFGWQTYALFDAGQGLRQIERLYETRETINIIQHDPPDNRILECAKAAGSDFIISEDRDLLWLNRSGKIQITMVERYLSPPPSGSGTRSSNAL